MDEAGMAFARGLAVLKLPRLSLARAWRGWARLGQEIGQWPR